jgi:hypothetical protein
MRHHDDLTKTYWFMLQALSELGLVIYTALDFGLGEDQERALSEDLETLLDTMASEGIVHT